MKFSKSIILACFSLIVLNSCDKNELESGYLPVGKFATRKGAETEALKTLVSRFASLPVAGFYKVKYEFDDVQLSPGLRGSNYHAHAIWYDKANNQLAVEFDIYSGTSCRWTNVDQAGLQKIIDTNQGLEAANQLATPSSQQDNCFKE